MNEIESVPLFSCPVFVTRIDTDSRPDFDKIDWITAKRNDINQISRDDKLLDRPEWLDIKTQLNEVCNTVHHSILRSDANTSVYITDSWINRSLAGMNRSRHNHVNSYYSGVLFFEHHPCQLNLYTPHPSVIGTVPAETNILNSQHWTFSPEPGLLVLFPSYIEHDTDPVDEAHSERHSVAFDTWVRGMMQPEHDPVRG